MTTVVAVVTVMGADVVVSSSSNDNGGRCSSCSSCSGTCSFSSCCDSSKPSSFPKLYPSSAFSAAVLLADALPAGRQTVVRGRGQLPERKWIALICSHYYRNSHNAQTDTHAACCHHHETFPLVMLGDSVCVLIRRLPGLSAVI